jgi:hypothetical protein
MLSIPADHIRSHGYRSHRSANQHLQVARLPVDQNLVGIAGSNIGPTATDIDGRGPAEGRFEDEHEQGSVRDNPLEEVLLGGTVQPACTDGIPVGGEDRNPLSVDVPGDKRVASNSAQRP